MTDYGPPPPGDPPLPPPPPPPPPPQAPYAQAPYPPGGAGPPRSFRPWLVGGLAVLLIAVAGVAVWALRSDNEDDEAETSAQEAASTTPSEPPPTTTATVPPSTAGSGDVVFADELEPGHCFDDSAFTAGGGTVGEITLVDCPSPHDAEVFGVASVGAGPEEPWPGDEGMATLVDSLCLGGFTDYVGIDYLDSAWAYGYYMPSEETWTKFEDRTAVCYLTDPRLEKLEGTKLNSMT